MFVMLYWLGFVFSYLADVKMLLNCESEVIDDWDDNAELQS